MKEETDYSRHPLNRRPWINVGHAAEQFLKLAIILIKKKLDKENQDADKT